MRLSRRPPRCAAVSGIEHVVLVMMEYCSLDHMLGWLPSANGKQDGLTFFDRGGVPHQTHQTPAPDRTRRQTRSEDEDEDDWEGLRIVARGEDEDEDEWEGVCIVARGEGWPVCLGYPWPEPRMPSIGGVDLVLSVLYSTLFVVLLVLSYRSVWRRKSRD
jgi:hypothetical protein